jgi:hypothetical protein
MVFCQSSSEDLGSDGFMEIHTARAMDIAATLSLTTPPEGGDHSPYANTAEFTSPHEMNDKTKQIDRTFKVFIIAAAGAVEEVATMRNNRTRKVLWRGPGIL